MLSLETPIPVELLQFLRVAWINSEEDLAVADKAFDGPITLQNELQAHVMLGLKLTQLLNAYPTKLEVWRSLFLCFDKFRMMNRSWLGLATM